MDKKIIYIIASLFTLVIIISVITFLKINSLEELTPRKIIVELENSHREFIPKVPEELDFCGEKVPLKDLDVFERMERELLVNVHWSSATILYLKRASRWFPIIEPILEKNKVPNDFKYLAVIESGLTNAISPAGAVGFWQFMIPSAKKYGLEVTKEVDERYHVEKSTEAACKYLKEAYSKYGNWTMAAASYNYGINGIDKQMERQLSNNYYSLYLVEETNRFIFRLLAIKEIFKDPFKYGFYLSDDELYKPFKTEIITIKTEIKDLAIFAQKHGINYKVLKIFNPWLRNNFLPNKNKKTYHIVIPKDGEIEIL
jgi:hypothetical protein